MRTLYFVLVLSVSLLQSAQAEDPVFFADANLKAAVENELWVSDPTPTDMLNLTSLYCTQNWGTQTVITSLTGLEYALNLRTLHIRLNEIDDISPLAGLVSLETVDLSQNQISDLSPLSSLAACSVCAAGGSHSHNGVTD